MKTKWLWVDDQKKLSRAVDDLDRAEIIAVDTEYDSFRYFREKLCLIQICADKTAYVFDPLGDINLSFLQKYLEDPEKIKVLHAADNDIRLLKRDYGFRFNNIYDTHRAALLLGFKELSLEKMIKEFLGEELGKSKKIQRSRWDNRPLTEEQLQYAVQDVLFLPGLYTTQSAQLRAKGLQETAEKAFEKIAATGWREKRIDRRGYEKIEGYSSLTPGQKELFKRLYIWRFYRARDENRAVFMFLSDHHLLALAQDARHPEKYLSQRKLGIYGSEIEKIIQTSGE
ncbi:MAG TPA: ribonuclease D [Smithella sp.]|mgnify:CR=1 FL=1|nr:ribonuclease D [Smithella sp.]